MNQVLRDEYGHNFFAGVNWDQKSGCGVYEGTEGKESGEAWNTTQEYWLSSSSHPDSGTIPYYAQTCHQTAQMRKFLEATNLRAGLFKALFLLFLNLFRWGKLLQSYWLRLWCCCMGFFELCRAAVATFKACRCFGTFGNLSSTSLQGWMKLSKYVLYIFLISFEARSWKMLHHMSYC